MTTAAPAQSSQSIDPQDPSGSTPFESLDADLEVLAKSKTNWARLPIRDRRGILNEMVKDFSAVAERWTDACMKAEGLAPGSTGEEWLAGAYFIVRNLRLLERALADVERQGAPRIPGPVRTREDGRVTAQVFPETLYDRIFYTGVTAEVWMEPGVRKNDLAKTQAVAYREEDPEGGICLVLGAGNVSSIGPMDILYKLFVDNQVVICKMHPVNAYLGPILADGFRALLDWGVLRIVYGDVPVGAYLCEHAHVDEIHITGSDKTVEAIVFGPGAEGQKRKAEKRPKLDKKISSELGNVSPVIVVPGPWAPSEINYQAENLAAMLTNNAGFNCNATRVIIQHAEWNQRRQLLDAFCAQLGHVPTRNAYYPGAADRYEAFLKAHPDARRMGQAAKGELPWAVIPNVDSSNGEDIAFQTEAFCSVCCETSFSADSIVEFIRKAVEFSNETLWGTLNATLLVHPASMKDPEVAAAVEQAIADLRYGTVSINNWAAIGYGLVITPWGAHPGHDLYDIQSGTGVVHNTLMFSKVQKSVVRSPFRMNPKPAWFPSHRTAANLGRKLTSFEAYPSPLKLPGIFWEALRG